ncbi:MAG: DNA-binding protein [Myxococcales bacterium]|nr:DNA-binding protein [Myxococcales bacterium]
MSQSPISNPEIADVLERVADLLEAQDANPHRVRAYRAAAETIRVHEKPLSEILALGGVEAVDALPTIGRTIAAHVAELVHRRGLSLLDRLEGEVSPVQLLTTLPGIGSELATRIHRDLHVDTLEELEVAVHDGRLDGVAGFGPRRVRAVREELSAILGRSARHRARREAWLASRREPPETLPRPDVDALLSIDAEYREAAQAGLLRRIAPRRFNPTGAAWLPILHAERDGWHFTALFSNTARAHELGRTRDWVVITYSRDGDEGQCTVVTERGGPLRGKRVVRGREDECGERVAARASPTAGGATLQ